MVAVVVAVVVALGYPGVVGLRVVMMVMVLARLVWLSIWLLMTAAAVGVYHLITMDVVVVVAVAVVGVVGAAWL